MAPGLFILGANEAYQSIGDDEFSAVKRDTEVQEESENTMTHSPSIPVKRAEGSLIYLREFVPALKKRWWVSRYTYP
jgi:hypothetical protein